MHFIGLSVPHFIYLPIDPIFLPVSKLFSHSFSLPVCLP
jgi:hypothetical protein